MFKTFIEELAQTPAPKDVVNQYDYTNPHNVIRRHNLLCYLRQMSDLQPKTMLVAEAPGYRGMRLTGVPFSSRRILLEGIEGVPLFGLQNGYGLPPEDGSTAWHEQTASIVWSVLRSVPKLPISWNSFPFHPHQPNKPLSNRKPRKPELEIGRYYLLKMLEMFAVESVIAVGNTAAEALHAIDIPCQKVRHPAQGGKNDFVAGITPLLSQ